MGIVIASMIILAWSGHLFLALETGHAHFTSPLLYLHILVQTYLFTGLFITGHDAMHGTVAPGNRLLNKGFGYFSVFLYAGMWYPRLIKNHRLHHQYPGTKYDPDFSDQSQNFWIWWARFMWKYLTVIQLVVMAVLFNVLKIWFPTENVILFWIIPAVLSTLQLFYFGTYLPHRRPHTDEMRPHNARTQRKNHIWAMLSCYFFGYHHEHHTSPGTPWWQLYRAKSAAK
jgi:beta-carotene ketolase (CrtW type)